MKSVRASTKVSFRFSFHANQVLEQINVKLHPCKSDIFMRDTSLFEMLMFDADPPYPDTGQLHLKL